MSNKLIKFNLDSKDIKVKKLLNGDFLKLEAYTISNALPNRNRSHFTKDSMVKAIPTFYDKPVLAYFNPTLGEEGDFMGHECPNDLQYDPQLDELYYDYTDPASEVPIGTIRQSDTVEIVEKDGLSWIKVTCVLWTKYNYRAVRSLLRSRKGKTKLSVEIEVIKSHMENGIEYIDEFSLDGFTLLGKDYSGREIEEGIAGAQAVAIDFMNEKFSNQRQCLAFAYSALDNYNNNVESSAKDLKSEQSSNTVFNDSASAVENEDKPQISMEGDKPKNKKGGISIMSLTMKAKMDLLTTAIKNSVGDNKYDVLVMDLDDNYVYYTTDWHETFYKAPYTITENGEEHDVQVDLANQERVISSWQSFAEDQPSETENKEFCGDETSNVEEKQDITDNGTSEQFTEEDNSSIEAEATNEVSNENNNTDVVETTEEFAEKETEAKEKCETEGEKVEEAKEDDGNEDDKDDDDEKEDDYECGKEGFAESIDTNAEPTEVNTGNQSMGEIIESSTENIQAAPVQTEGEATGAANTEVEAQITDTEGVVINNNIADEPVNSDVNNEEAKAEVSQPDDSLKERDNYSAEKDGEKVDYDTLLAKYNKLEEKFNEMNNSLKMQEAEKLVKVGTNFVNEDAYVNDEAKQEYISQVTERCNNYELTSEEEVINFAKSLMAMYYYEHLAEEKNHKSEEFSLTLTKDSIQESIEPHGDLKDAIHKLDSLNNN